MRGARTERERAREPRSRSAQHMRIIRRPTRPPRRLHASHDEHVPSLAVLQKWTALPSLPVCVAEVPGKGLGVLARHALPAGTVVAEYRFRLVKRAACSPGDYRVEVRGARGMVGKMDARTFGPPIDGVAQVGPLLNEPCVGGRAAQLRPPRGLDRPSCGPWRAPPRRLSARHQRDSARR